MDPKRAKITLYLRVYNDIPDDDDGGKSTRLHSLVNDSRAVLILMTTPLTTLQTSQNLEKMRIMAEIYNDCSRKSSIKMTDWTQIYIDEAQSACEFQEEMVSFLII